MHGTPKRALAVVIVAAGVLAAAAGPAAAGVPNADLRVRARGTISWLGVGFGVNSCANASTETVHDPEGAAKVDLKIKNNGPAGPVDLSIADFLSTGLWNVKVLKPNGENVASDLIFGEGITLNVGAGKAKVLLVKVKGVSPDPGDEILVCFRSEPPVDFVQVEVVFD